MATIKDILIKDSYKFSKMYKYIYTFNRGYGIKIKIWFCIHIDYYYILNRH